MKYWWYAVILLVLAVVLTVLAIKLSKRPKLSYIISMTLSCVFLTYKSVEFIYYRIIGYPEYPVEYSQFAYFMMGVTMATGFKKTRFLAAFSSLTGALGYIIAGSISPDSMVTTMSSTYYVVFAVIQHELLLFLGLTMMFNVERYRYRDLWIPVVGSLLFIGYSLLVYYHYIYPDYLNVEKIVIVKIVMGTVIGFVIGEENLTPAIQAVTSVAVILLVVGCMFLLCRLNNKVFDRKEKRMAQLGETMPAFDYGLIYLFKKLWAERKAVKETKGEN